MFFKNLQFFTFPMSLDFGQISELIADHALKPVGPLEFSSQGFIHPFGRGRDAGVHTLGNAIWIAIGTETKILPAAVVSDALQERLQQIEGREGRKPGGRARKRLKDDLIHELLPRAMVKRGRVDAVIDLDLGLIYVNTASRKAAESVVSEVRALLGSFPALPVNPEVSPRSVLTAWIAGETPPEDVAMGDEAELRDPIQGGAVARLRHQELYSDEVVRHLESGKQATRLGLLLSDHLSFVIGDDLSVRKVKFLDGALEALNDERDSVDAELDARFALQTGEVRGLWRMIAEAFKITQPSA